MGARQLVGFSLDGTPGTAVFNVTNRQKPSGLLYGTEHEEMIEAVIAAVIARAQSPTAHQSLLSELAENVRHAAGVAQIQPPAEVLRGELTSGDGSQGLPPPPTPGAITQPGWLPDPYRRFEYRWWNGTGWTSDVSRAGRAQPPCRLTVRGVSKLGSLNVRPRSERAPGDGSFGACAALCHDVF